MKEVPHDVPETLPVQQQFERNVTLHGGRSTALAAKRHPRLGDGRLENRFTFAAFNILVPYPNTPLYRRLQSECRLLYGEEWWLHPNDRFNDAPFAPCASG
jgi:hypothetical protein